MKTLFLSFLLLLAAMLSAQVQPTYPVKKAEGRPTIGLCLSGGGAKGFAHIGIIKIIDSLGIPIDYVTGTSMGSIVGGLYAIGYTGEQIEETVLTTDWPALMSSTPERKYQSYSTKDYSSRNLFTVGLNDFKIVLPAGLNNASKVYQKLHNATIGYHGYQNFLEFPRGFICIGADLNRGREVVFKEGSLPDAMRASMAIPSMFTPHEVDGKTIVDGGTINNFPTDELVKLGCDIIIGVDLHNAASDTASVTITQVLEKTAMFINYRDYEVRQALCNLLINPDLSGFGGGDFDKCDGIINRGSLAGRQHLAELVEIAELVKDAPKKDITPYSRPDSVVIGEVKINGLKKTSDKYVLGVIDNTEEKKSIDELEESASALYGSQYFNTVSYNLLEQDNKQYILELNAKENTNDLDIGVGLHHDPDFETSLLINVAAKNAIIKGSRFNLDLIASERPRFRLLYEVDRGVSPGFGIRSDLYFMRPELIIDNALEGRYTYDDWTTGVYYLTSVNNMGVFRIGGEFNYAFVNVRDVPSLRESLDPQGNNADATIFKFDHVNIFAEIGIDVLDDKDYPKRGHYLELAGRYHTGVINALEETFKDHFITIYGSYQTALSPTTWLTFKPELTSGWSFLNDASQTYSYGFHVGGLGKNYFHYQTPFLGYTYMEALGLSNISKGGLEMRFNPFGKHYISVMINYALWFDVYDTGFFNDRPQIENPIFTGAVDVYDFAGWGVKYGIDTFLGPIEVTAHRNFDEGSFLFYFNLGYWF